MLNLYCSTEFEFRKTYGKLKDIVINAPTDYVSITDSNTFGHLLLNELCHKYNKIPIFGVNLNIVQEKIVKTRQQNYKITLLAKNLEGLQELYKLNSEATKYYYYVNRLDYNDLKNIPNNLVVIFYNTFLSQFLNPENAFYGLSPMSCYCDYVKLDNRFKTVALSDNLYDLKEHDILYETLLGNDKFEKSIEKRWLLNEQEWREELYWLNKKEQEEALDNINFIKDQITKFDLLKGGLPTVEGDLRKICFEKFQNFKFKDNPIYVERLNYELSIIYEKKFQDYFLIVKDLIEFAKTKMCVGYGRGSAAGSLVCFVLGITGIDPIKYDLIFERFISKTRKDMPDVDIDFQDSKRNLCFDYLTKKYGEKNVARIAAVSEYKSDIFLLEYNKLNPIPKSDLEKIKAGAELHNFSVKSYLEEDIEMAEKYPLLKICANLENHLRHKTIHAAGLIVNKDPLYKYCSIDYRDNTLQVYKDTVESINLLKIDCLSLNTLTIVDNILVQIEKDMNWLLEQDREDPKVFEIYNNLKLSNIFQYEGAMLQMLVKQIGIHSFKDISILIALGRPGASQGIDHYAKGDLKLPGCEEILKETKGVLVYQEQLMRIANEIGLIPMEKVDKLRKQISHQAGGAQMDEWKNLFLQGAKQKLTEKEALEVWNYLYKAGSYSFNKSHSIAYALLSYHTAFLKCYYPLEFALAALKATTDKEKIFKLLIELENEGLKVKIFDKDLSEEDWTLKDGVLYGGLNLIKGCGKTKAQSILKKRKQGKLDELLPGEKKLLFLPNIPYLLLNEVKTLYEQYSKNWQGYFINKPLQIKELKEDRNDIALICFVIDFEIKKNSKKMEFMKLIICDGTGIINACLTRIEYDLYKNEIEKEQKYFIRGAYKDDGEILFISKIKKSE